LEGIKRIRKNGLGFEGIRGDRGFLAKAPSPSPPSIQTEQRRGGAAAPASGGAGRPASRPRRRTARGEKEEGDEGVDSTHSPWVKAARGGGSAAAADRWCWPTVVARCGCAARQWRVAVTWWCGEGPLALIYRRRRRVREGRYFLRRGGSPAGSAGAGRVRSPGDGTARAGAEVVEQASGLFNPVAQRR
jgi:hypothetical protein